MYIYICSSLMLLNILILCARVYIYIDFLYMYTHNHVDAPSPMRISIIASKYVHLTKEELIASHKVNFEV